jgi:tetratricopeptide (TPR) repeat protein
MTIKKTRKNTFFNVRPELLVCLFLIISILAVYWQVRNCPFVNYDDGQYVTQNQYVQAGLTLESIKWSITDSHASNWHPLTWMSHMLDCQIYGLDPGRHHLTNVFFHILNTLLLFLVFKKMTGDFWQSSFVAALFALHPLHVESVAWVAERKDVLSTFFWIMTLWSYTRYVERSGFDRYLLVLLFFILGLMAKPMLVTLPFVLLLLDYWPLNRFQFEKSGYGNKSEKGRFPLALILEKIPLFVLSAASSVATYLVQKSSGAFDNLAEIPIHMRTANALISYVSYIGKMIWPHNLAVFYPYPKSIPVWKVASAGMLLVIVSAVVFRMKRTKPYLTTGWLWYIGTLVPVIGLVQVGLQAMADRYTYVSLIGLFIMIAWGVPDVMSKWRYKKIGLSVLTATTISFLVITSWFQIGYWSNSTNLFEHTLDVTVDNSVAHVKLGEALGRQGKIDAAVKHYLEALRIKPDLVIPHLNLGVILRGQGKFVEAVYHFSTAIQIKPDCAEAYYELGVTQEKEGDFDAAVGHYLEALRIKLDYAKAHNNLGIILARQKKDEEAIFHFHEAIRIDSNYAEPHCNLGIIYANQRNIEKAILHYKKALYLNPNMAQALYNLSWILGSCENERFRNGEEAVKLAEKLCKIAQNNQPLALDVLAAAYAETGKFNEAVTVAKKALELALKQSSSKLVLTLKKRLQLYQKGRLYLKSQSSIFFYKKGFSEILIKNCLEV